MALPSKVAFHFRQGGNNTNMRSESLYEAFEAHGIPSVRSTRDLPVAGSELVIQTGFASSPALLDAIERRIPYIIMEAPYFRSDDLNTHSSWGYNGLQGGSWRPEAPEAKRPHPPLKPMKEGGKTLIIGQKPTDHSLRGADHVQWILDRKAELPEADFRHHPLMVPTDTQPPIELALQAYARVVVYTSTVGTDALLAGCEVRADNRLCAAHGVTDRASWAHDLSWGQGAHTEFGDLVPYILSGYEEACARTHDGLVERPRGRVDGQSVCRRYYQHILRGSPQEGA